MGLRSVGSGGSSSFSSSGLSASAPPFTVERATQKPNSNSLLHYSESPYAASFGSTWQYSQHSAPIPGVFSKPELDVDSGKTTVMPSASDYSYLASESVNMPGSHWSTINPSVKTSVDAFSCGGKVHSYYPPYVSPVISEDNPLMALNNPIYEKLPASGLPASVSSQVDYTKSLSGLEYTAHQWNGVRNGLADGNQVKMMELDGSFFSEKANLSGSLVQKNYTTPEIDAVQCMDMSNEGPISYGKVADLVGNESRTGSLITNDKSFLAQTTNVLPFEYTRMPVAGSSSTFTKSRSLGPQVEPIKSNTNYHKQYNPYGKCIQPHDTCTSDTLSITKPSSPIVIRPPISNTGSIVANAVPHKTLDMGQIAAFHSEISHSHKLVEGKETELPLGFEDKEDIDRIVFASSSVRKEIESQPAANDIVENSLKERNGSQIPVANVKDDLSLSVDKTFKPTDNSFDLLDHHNPNVDSPCWKGAPASRVCPFDAVANAPSSHFMRKSEECGNLNVQMSQFLSKADCTGGSHLKAHKKDNVGDYAMGVLLPLRNTAHASCQGKGQVCSDSVRSASENQFLSRSESTYQNVRKGYDQPDDSNSNLDVRSSCTKELNIASVRCDLEAGLVETVMQINDASEGGSVAFRAVENVLHSPSSQEDAIGDAQPFGKGLGRKMDIQTIIKTMHNLSELLVSHSLAGACALNKQDYEALKDVIGNINECLPKKIIQTAPTEKQIPAQQDMVEEPGVPPEFHKLNSESAMDTPGQLHYQQMNEQRRNSDFGKKAENLLHIPLSTDDIDVSVEDNVAQAIKVVLDENFHYEEDMQPQALLFKNLWLDAEAKLCAISYKARFDRMRIEMEKYMLKKVEDARGNSAVTEKISSPNSSTELSSLWLPTCKVDDGTKQKPNVHSSISTKKGAADEVEASVMARFDILKCRDENSRRKNMDEQPKQNAVDGWSVENAAALKKISNASSSPKLNMTAMATPEADDGTVQKTATENFSTFTKKSPKDDGEAYIIARLNVLKSRDDNRLPHMEEQQQQDVTDAWSAGEDLRQFMRLWSTSGSLNVPAEHQHAERIVNGCKSNFGHHSDSSENEFHIHVTDDPVMEITKDRRLQNQTMSRLWDNSSSDWEHVLKDDFTW